MIGIFAVMVAWFLYWFEPRPAWLAPIWVAVGWYLGDGLRWGWGRLRRKRVVMLQTVGASRANPRALEVRQAPEFREAFARAMTRFVQDMVPPVVDEEMERMFSEFVAAKSQSYAMNFRVSMVIGDTRFMPYLHEESRRPPV